MILTHYFISLPAFLQFDDGDICKPRRRVSEEYKVRVWAHLIWLDGCWIGILTEQDQVM